MNYIKETGDKIYSIVDRGQKDLEEKKAFRD